MRNGAFSFNGHRILVWEGEDFWKWMPVADTQQYECVKCHREVHFKIVKIVSFICV